MWPVAAVFSFFMKKKQSQEVIFDLHPEGSCSGKRYEVYKREIIRPKINYYFAVIFFISHFVIGFLISLLIGLISLGSFPDAIHFSFCWFWLFTVGLFLLSSRFSLIFFVRLYQRYADEEIRQRCYMIPSCSEYAILAFKKYGSIIGAIKIIKRLKRCTVPGYEDYP